MNPFDKHQIRIAKKTLTLSDVGANIMGGMTKPEAILLLKQSGVSITAITKILVDSGHTNKEVSDLFISAMHVR